MFQLYQLIFRRIVVGIKTRLFFPLSSRVLILFTSLYAGSIFLGLLFEKDYYKAEFNTCEFVPQGIAHLIPFRLVSWELAQPVFFLMLGALIFICLGSLVRTSLFVALTSYLFFFSNLVSCQAPEGGGFMDPQYTVPPFVFLFLFLSRWSGARTISWSNRSIVSGWALYAILFNLVSIYFLSGLSKVRNLPDWVSGHTLYDYLLFRGMALANDRVNYLLDYPHVVKLLANLVLIFELASPMALLGGIWTIVFLGSVLIFQMAVYYLMYVEVLLFLGPSLLLVIVPNWWPKFKLRT